MTKSIQRYAYYVKVARRTKNIGRMERPLVAHFHAGMNVVTCSCESAKLVTVSVLVIIPM